MVVVVVALVVALALAAFVREGSVENSEAWEPHRFGDDEQYHPTSLPMCHSLSSVGYY